MNFKNNHLPVLLSKINNLNIISNGIYIDGTFGGGSHSKLILSKLSLKGHLYSIDRDPETFKIINKNNFFKKKNFTFINGKISKIKQYALKYNFIGKVNGILLDLGISNIQLSNPNRGFSYKINTNLDMRMNNTKGITAKQWLNTAKKEEIINVLKNNGQEIFYNRIAKLIIEKRKKYTISTTYQLNDIIMQAIPKNSYNRYHLHPSTRTYQAIRIHINNELEELKICLKDLLSLLKDKGILIIITFHSLETKIIKDIVNNYKNKKNIFISNKYLINDLLKNNNIYYFKFLKKVKPNIIEKKKNPFCKSAIMRIYIKTKNIL